MDFVQAREGLEQPSLNRDSEGPSQFSRPAIEVMFGCANVFLVAYPGQRFLIVDPDRGRLKVTRDELVGRLDHIRAWVLSQKPA